jgi:nitrate reductase molybdenum cofactor assembly chaperone NarJ/NarW
MLILKALSRLLGYPETETITALREMSEIIEQDGLLTPSGKSALLGLIDSYRSAELLELQERYVALFDRGRYLSLHLFEHVHGESRDRGQAMVNLLKQYEAHGFELVAQELPDYIPLFLEFLSQLDDGEALDLLQEAMPVLSLLGARLAERGNEYQAVFAALESIAGEPEEVSAIRRQAATENPDGTLIHMDEIWEEEAVSFMGAGNNCQTRDADANPIVMTSRQQFASLKDANTTQARPF